MHFNHRSMTNRGECEILLQLLVPAASSSLPLIGLPAHASEHPTRYMILSWARSYPAMLDRCSTQVALVSFCALYLRRRCDFGNILLIIFNIIGGRLKSSCLTSVVFQQSKPALQLSARHFRWPSKKRMVSVQWPKKNPKRNLSDFF